MQTQQTQGENPPAQTQPDPGSAAKAARDRPAAKTSTPEAHRQSRSVGEIAKNAGTKPLEKALPYPESDGIKEGAAQANSLISAVWRSTDRCHQCASLVRTGVRFTNHSVSGVREAVRLAFALSTKGSEAYFACAEYTTSENRTAANAAGAWALWLDIDCGENKAAKGKGYRTVEEADLAVQQFCRDSNLPSPTHIVDSGGGLHVYWALDNFLATTVWQENAKKLKGIAEQYGLLADPARTADIASVLRVPGTLNHKYDPPRPVELIYAADTYLNTAAMLAAIDAAYIPKHKAPPRQAFASDCYQPDEAPNPKPIEKLAALLECLDPDLGYDDWCRVGMVLHHETQSSDEGLALFDNWSSGGKKYKGARETRNKWGSFKLGHPNPLKIGTLIFMVQAACNDGVAIMAANDDQFDIVDDEEGA